MQALQSMAAHVTSLMADWAAPGIYVLACIARFCPFLVGPQFLCLLQQALDRKPAHYLCTSWGWEQLPLAAGCNRLLSTFQP